MELPKPTTGAPPWRPPEDADKLLFMIISSQAPAHPGDGTTPRVTVVMPVYNGARFIFDGVRSALNSSYRDLELLVVDDGSTDDSIIVATRAAAGDPRLRVVRGAHQGVAAARNIALREARGTYIANLDSDDVTFPQRFARQVAYLDRHPRCVALGVRTIIADGHDRALRVTQRYFAHTHIDASLLDGNGGAIGNDGAMFRREVALRIGGYEEHLTRTGEDHDFWLRLAEVGELACLPEVLIWYRLHDTNVSGGSDHQERRLPVTLANLERAFTRRGMTDRAPAKRLSPPLSAAELRRDAALLRHFSGQRWRALALALVAMVLNPADAATRAAVTTILTTRPGIPLAPDQRSAR